MEDFEEELDAYVVRKKIINTRLLKQKRNTPRPLLLCDVLGAETKDGEFFSVFKGKVELRLCLLAGRISGFICVNKRFRTYLFDDGTACIEFVVFKEDKKAKTNRSRRVVNFYYKPEFLGSLHEILKSAERLVDTTNLIIGTALVVLGRISLHHGKMCVIGLSLFVQNGANRDMEIAFKDYLVKCYKAETHT